MDISKYDDSIFITGKNKCEIELINRWYRQIIKHLSELSFLTGDTKDKDGLD